MDHALRVDHDIDPVVWKIEQEMGLDHLQCLVRESGAVDRDLLSHPPGRVSKRILNGCRSNAVGAPVAKWAARCREHNPPYFRARMSGDALEDRTVLAADRHNFARARGAR